MKEIWTNFLNVVGKAWWIEVTTESPRCAYYFGPFPSDREAEAEKSGYVEDLETEGAQGISVVIKRCKPGKLTIVYDDGAGLNSSGKTSPAFG